MNSPVICPCVTPRDMTEYREQLSRIQRFAKRIHLDFMDGHFAPSLSPSLNDIYWQPGPAVDFHLMYQQPMRYIEQVVRLQPHLVIIHAEAEGVVDFLQELEGLSIKRGLALLPQTAPTEIEHLLPMLDHVLIFSGDLGHFGGTPDLTLLHKVEVLKKMKPSLEFGWDGGVNDKNSADLVAGGIEVLNTGGFIQNAKDPEEAYATLEKAIRGI